MTSANIAPPAEVDEVPAAAHRQRQHRHPRWYRTLRKVIRRVNWRLLLSVSVVLILVALVASVALVADASTRVQGSRASLTRMVTALNKKSGEALSMDDFARLKAGVDDLRDNLVTARRQTVFLRPFTRFNDDLAAQFEILDASHNLTLAVSDILTGVEPTLVFLLGDKQTQTVAVQISSGTRIVELLQLGQGQFSSATEQLAQAQAILDRLPLARLSPDRLLDAETVRATHGTIQQINHLLLNLPELLTRTLGISGEQHYLILSQNSDELRPSGGYISTYGWLSVLNSRITGYDYGATSEISPSTPPPGVTNPYRVPNWWIRYGEPVNAAWDGSWTPDFAVTSAMAKWYYDGGNNPHSPVDGVIGIDLIGFQTLLNALGDVAVPEYSTTVTPANFRAMIYDIREHGDGDMPHKRFLAALYRRMIEKLQAVDDKQTSNRLLGAVTQGLIEKHIMIYLPDPTFESALDVLGWSGKQDVTAGHDYLMAADANLGNKSNSSVIRQLTYDVEVSADGTLNSHATVTYDYPAGLADKDPAVDPPRNGPRDYANLLQLYTPANSVLADFQGEQGQPKIVPGDSRTEFVSRFILLYNSAATFQYAYRLPVLVENLGPYQRYRLLVQKQPGTRGDPLSVQVKLPTGAALVSAIPIPAASYSLDQPVIEFQLNLTTDQWIEVLYRLST